MDWKKWIPTPLRPERTAEERIVQQRKQARSQKRKRSIHANPVGQPLVFQTSEDCCVCRPTGAVVASPVLLGLGDSYDAQGSTELPAELLASCEKVAKAQLLHQADQEEYRGPIALLKKAFKATWTPGSTTVALAAIDNSTVIHGQLHPMVAMLSLGGCELLQLRRSDHTKHAQRAPPDCASKPVVGAGELEVVFQTLPPKHCTSAGVALSRNAFDTDRDTDALEAIEAQSSVHCASARQGDIVILMSSGFVTDGKLSVDECVAICREMLPPTTGEHFYPSSPELLQRLAQRLAKEATCKLETEPTEAASAGHEFEEGFQAAGSVVVAEVVEQSSDDSGIPSDAVVPEKQEAPPLSRMHSMPEDGPVLDITPELQGPESTNTLHCVMSLGDYALQVSLDLPKIPIPKIKVPELGSKNGGRRSRAKRYICDLD